MSALVRAELVSRWRMLAGVAAGLAAFSALMASTFQSLGVGMLGSAFSTHTPRAISALSGTAGANLLSADGWLGFGFAHPMFLLLGSTVAVAIPAASIAGTIETGRADLLFVRPRPRHQLLLSWIAVWAIAQLTVAAATLLGTLAGSMLDADIAQIGVVPVASAVLQAGSLFAFIAGTAFLASSLTTTRSAAVGISIASVVALYLVNFCSSIITGLGWLHWLSPFGYYAPVQTITDGLALGDFGLLVGGGALLTLSAAVILERRDLG